MNIMTADRPVAIVEKTAQAHFVLEVWRKAFPNRDIDIVSLNPGTGISGPALDIPRELPLTRVPMLLEPRYRGDVELRVLSTRAQPGAARSLVEQSDCVICACDSDPNGQFAFAKLMRAWRPADGPGHAYPCLWLRDHSISAGVKELKAQKTTRDTLPDLAFRMGEASGWFNAQWLYNSLPLFGRQMTACGAPPDAKPMSKYMLMLLWHLSEQTEAVREADLLLLMARGWTGTGKYKSDDPYNNAIGSPASRGAIIDNLKSAGFIDGTGSSYGLMLRITPAGRRFLALTHPRCRDDDLAFRLREWGENWPESRPAMERWIRTFFGRQKIFFDKAVS